MTPNIHVLHPMQGNHYVREDRPVRLLLAHAKFINLELIRSLTTFENFLQGPNLVHKSDKWNFAYVLPGATGDPLRLMIPHAPQTG